MSGRIVLIGCSATKAPGPCAARDLFVGTAFTKGRRYAERSGHPWFILSAKWGLLAPEELLAPYDVFLKDQPTRYREAWGRWVIAQLARIGPTGRPVLEVHAGASYVDPLRSPAAEVGWTIDAPLSGLSMGRRLAWYSGRCAPTGATVPELEPRAEPEALQTPMAAVDAAPQALSPSTPAGDLAVLLVGQLLDPAIRRGYSELAGMREGLRHPGLYAWFVDADGAADLSRGLEHPVSPGLVYAGQAGATHWPSAKPSDNTLWGRLMGMHFGGSRTMSTFRLTLASILSEAYSGTAVSEGDITKWMAAHLCVAPIAVDDRDQLGHIEKAVLARLDPPFNLHHVPGNQLRSRLRELRRAERGGLSVAEDKVGL